MIPFAQQLATLEKNYYGGHLSKDGYEAMSAEVSRAWRADLKARRDALAPLALSLRADIGGDIAAVQRRIHAGQKLAMKYATMPGKGHATFRVSVKDGLAESGSVEMYAAMFNNVDHGGDVILPGAFRNLPEFIESGWIAISHENRALPVAFVESAVQDSRGLKIRARFHTTPEAQATRIVVAERMAAGKAVKCSFGYRVLDASKAQRDGDQVRLLKALEIYEASIVNMPMNPLASVTAVKS